MITSLKNNIYSCIKLEREAGFVPTVFNWSKPASWPELRHITPAGAISLLLCDKYPYLSFCVGCSGGYKVIVDDEEYRQYNNNETCSITLSDILTQGVLISEPEALTAHTVLIVPQNQNAVISSFKCVRTQESGTEQQGILWTHFNIENNISLYLAFSRNNAEYRNPMLCALTAKNNILKTSDLQEAFSGCSNLEYLPVLDFNSITSSLAATFYNCQKLSEVNIKNPSFSNLYNAFCNNTSIEYINISSPIWSQVSLGSEFIVNAPKLKMPLLDLSSASLLASLRCYGTSSSPMYGFKGLLVSNQAPLNGTAPQISVNYTGLDRNALVSLFNSLPQVNAGQKISIIGAAGASELSSEDIALATGKGWEVLI